MQSELRNPIPPNLVQHPEICHTEHYKTTTGTVHDVKQQGCSYGNLDPLYKKAPGHWKVHYNKDLHEKVAYYSWKLFQVLLKALWLRLLVYIGSVVWLSGILESWNTVGEEFLTISLCILLHYKIFNKLPWSFLHFIIRHRIKENLIENVHDSESIKVSCFIIV